MSGGSLTALLGRRPILIALAGPNGAGKSTFYGAQLADLELPFVNADVLALTSGVDAYEAAKMADLLRRRMIAERQSFLFETVFSDPVGDKLEFLKQAETAGYAVLLIFIGIAAPSLSVTRVAIRVSQGGHDVPTDKLIERYPRVRQNLRRALVEISHIRVYDNSDLRDPYRLVATREDGGAVVLHGTAPEWLQPLLPVV
jgi:predicted ABC-type ATPase